MDLRHVYMVSTRNYLDTIPEKQDVEIREVALKRLGDKGKNQYGETIPDFVIFDPSFNGEVYQDDNRSLKIGKNGIPAKVYVKLDDYHSSEQLSESIGQRVNTQFVVTFMMAEDY